MFTMCWCISGRIHFITQTWTQTPETRWKMLVFAGAVLQSPRKLNNKFRTLIDSFIVSEPSNAHAEWTSKRNRDGLIYPADEFHEFFLLGDTCISGHLTTCKLSLDLKNNILKCWLGMIKYVYSGSDWIIPSAIVTKRGYWYIVCHFRIYKPMKEEFSITKPSVSTMSMIVERKGFK